MEQPSLYRGSVRGACGLNSFWVGRRFYVQCEVSILMSHSTMLAIKSKIRKISEITETFLNLQPNVFN
jgi:hypothetical protein